ncbi:hypothetical protein BpHYR1_023071 [Brachionus plicatilis]|uniref:Uncharacterized protein n=1 Tax=Brachionus plicatilis TaxID=10195 RepID=A0A3M7PI36_BRAPC|nr:hypothetical protein BpHYR1_023071 [Brachionus plicatilis]
MLAYLFLVNLLSCSQSESLSSLALDQAVLGIELIDLFSSSVMHWFNLPNASSMFFEHLETENKI